MRVISTKDSSRKIRELLFNLEDMFKIKLYKPDFSHHRSVLMSIDDIEGNVNKIFLSLPQLNTSARLAEYNPMKREMIIGNGKYIETLDENHTFLFGTSYASGEVGYSHRTLRKYTIPYGTGIPSFDKVPLILLQQRTLGDISDIRIDVIGYADTIDKNLKITTDFEEINL